MPPRQCTKTKADVTSPSKRSTLPITMEKYDEIIGNWCAYREWVDEMIDRYPELFPEAIRDDYSLHEERGSNKLAGIRLRRICSKRRDAQGKKRVFTIAPSGVMPYLWLNYG